MKKINKKIINKIFILFIAIFSCLLIPISTNVYAASEKPRFVVLGGDSIGLRLETDVYITGKYEVTTDTGRVKPWKDANIMVDDIIVELNNKKINGIDDIKNIVKSCDEGYIPIKVKRNNNIIESNILIITNIKGDNTLGLYVKDNVLGVGTLTYYDLKTKTFGALGHQAINQEIIKGKICDCKINGIVKGMRGQPGEKEAVLENNEIGEITTNNKLGIFGKLTNFEFDNKYQLVQVAKAKEVVLGKANIITVLEDNKKETFEIEIIEVKSQFYEDIKGIKFRVTDQELLIKTGGIIQGMSGSPIIQNGKLVGAVSHVLINDSTIGYGVFSEWMINYS